MEEKKADNKIIEKKNQKYATEEKLAYSEKKMRGIEDLEDNFSHLNKNLNICVELLNLSIRNKEVNKKLGYMNDDSTVGFKKTSSSLTDEKDTTKKEIVELNEQIDKLTDEIKELYNEIENEIEKVEEKKEKIEEIQIIEE